MSVVKVKSKQYVRPGLIYPKPETNPELLRMYISDKRDKLFSVCDEDDLWDNHKNSNDYDESETSRFYVLTLLFS